MRYYNTYTLQEILTLIRAKENFSFLATREDLKFETIEAELNNINFNHYFSLPILNSVEAIVDFIVLENLERIIIDPLDKIKFLTHIYGGLMGYQRIGDGNGNNRGDDWEVYFNFPQ